MITGNEENEVVLVLSQEEYDYMFKLLLDYGAYAPPETMRTELARKIAKPAMVRDGKLPSPLSWLWSMLPVQRFVWNRQVSGEKTSSTLTPA